MVHTRWDDGPLRTKLGTAPALQAAWQRDEFKQRFQTATRLELGSEAPHRQALALQASDPLGPVIPLVWAKYLDIIWGKNQLSKMYLRLPMKREIKGTATDSGGKEGHVPRGRKV